MNLLAMIAWLFMPAAAPSPEPRRAHPEPCVCVGNPPQAISAAPGDEDRPERRRGIW